MTEFADLYQELVLDHGRRPRNFRRMERNTHAEGYNPLCGDKINLQLKIQGDVVTDAAFQGSGCAISTASASLMTETLKGKTREQAERLFDKFHGLITGAGVAPSEIGKLAALSGCAIILPA
jgi:nitrogen fixation NifU-like protein